MKKGQCCLSSTTSLLLLARGSSSSGIHPQAPPETLPPSPPTVRLDSTARWRSKEVKRMTCSSKAIFWTLAPLLRQHRGQGARKRKVLACVLGSRKPVGFFSPSAFRQPQWKKQLHFKGINNCLCRTGTALVLGLVNKRMAGWTSRSVRVVSMPGRPEEK